MVHDGDGEIAAVGRQRDAFWKRTDREVIHDTRRLHREVDEADDVGSAAGEAAPTFATMAKSPRGEMSSPYGCRPAAMSTFVYWTVVPFTLSTEILLSLNRVTSARFPSGVKTGRLISHEASHTDAFPASLTVVP
jgi:hypothetical protein